MTAGKYNFLVEQGAQHEVTFRYKLSDGSYQNLDNYKVRMAVKNHITDTTFVYRASSDRDEAGHANDSAIVADQGTAANTGKFILTIPTNTTTNFGFNQGVYDLELVDPNDVVIRLLEGKFRVSPQVSV